MYSGHCGTVGIGGVITIISAGELIWVGASVGLIASFYSQSLTYSALAAPYIFDAFAPVAWGTGFLVGAVGFIILSTVNTKLRQALCNIWIGVLLLHLIAVAVYGVHFVMKMRDLYLIHLYTFTAITDKIGEKAGFNEKMKAKTSEGGIVFQFAEQASAGMIVKYAPYPMNVIFYAGLRPEVSSFFCIVLPVMFNLFALPFVIAIRNYFTSRKSGVVRHRAVYDGVPLSNFICAGLPEKHEPKSDFYGFVEEDLASTFDGSAYSESDYSESDGSYTDEESLVPSSRYTSEDGH